MRRTAVAASLLALVMPAAARAQAPPLRARLAACTTGPQAADRTAAFTGSMPTVHGARRLAMRFDLLVRVPPSLDYRAMVVPGLGVWKRSTLGRVGFIFTQRVQALLAPASYRAVVRFRWYGRRNVLLRTEKRATAACHQPDWRPDLRAGALFAGPGPTPDVTTYRLMVRNDGRTDAGAFDVALTLGQLPPLTSRAAQGLAAGARTAIEFTGPPCAPGSTLVFTLDATAEVAESHEVDDAVVRDCPLTA